MHSTELKLRRSGAVCWALVAALSLAVCVQAAEKKKPEKKSDGVSSTSGQAGAKDTSEATVDEAAIRAAVDSYVNAYNRGDAKAVAGHWSESGEWISPTGQRFRGRAAIEKELTALFSENKGSRIEVLGLSIRIVCADAAVEEGTVRVLRPAGAPIESTYLAIHVKKGGQWKLDSVRETNVPDAPSPSSRLEELAWLVGDWVHEEAGAAVEAHVAWTKNKTFLSYAFKASVPGEVDLEGTQVVGWDPAARTLRSWMFDSDGGFGEATWSKKDKSWAVKLNQVLPDGRKASATNIYTPVDANSYTWRSIGRKLDGQFLPNIDDVKFVRKTASSAAAQPAKAVETLQERGAKK